MFVSVLAHIIRKRFYGSSCCALLGSFIVYAKRFNLDCMANYTSTLLHSTLCGLFEAGGLERQ